MKSVLLTGIIVNYESPIRSSENEIEYKIIGLKGIDLYTLSETELSIQENATRVISCEYAFETGEYSIVVRYFSNTHQISAIYIKSVSGGLLQDIYFTRTVVYNANLDILFNANSNPIRASISNIISFYFHVSPNKISLELSTVYDHMSSYSDFSFVGGRAEFTDAVKNYLLTKISSGLYRYDDKLIVLKEFDCESLIIPDDISEIVLNWCKTVKNIILNSKFKSIAGINLGNISSIAVSRSLNYKQFTEIAIFAMSIKRVSNFEFARCYDIGNYEACFTLFQTDWKLADKVFGDIKIIVY